MLRCLFIVIVLATVGCATTANYDKILDSYVGMEEINLVRNWGVPAQSYEVGGRKFLTYTSYRNVRVPGVAPTYQTSVVGNTAYTNAVGGSSAMNIDKSCATTFEIDGSRVVSWSHKGNDCKAK